ncbi:hypothetical protein IMZ48_25020 [Candidatus Bathyarchaeota archaeon]|nr:hypothetical protein [Candidatus Bathyarchaeota archaeon]
MQDEVIAGQFELAATVDRLCQQKSSKPRMAQVGLVRWEGDCDVSTTRNLQCYIRLQKNVANAAVSRAFHRSSCNTPERGRQTNISIRHLGFCNITLPSRRGGAVLTPAQVDN